MTSRAHSYQPPKPLPHGQIRPHPLLRLATKSSDENPATPRGGGGAPHGASNGGAVKLSSLRRPLAASALAGLLLLTGCGGGPTFEKVDLRGHVRVEGTNPGEGYCFHVPQDWEIRAQLEGADVVCMSPPGRGFRDTVVAKTLTAQELKDPQRVLTEQMSKFGENLKVLEPWEGPAKPMLVELSDTKFAASPLNQLLFVHMYPGGEGVLICCTTLKENMAAKRPQFEEMVAKANFDIETCAGPGGVPTTFPTPGVTYSPGAAPVQGATPIPNASGTPVPAASASGTPAPPASASETPAAPTSPPSPSTTAAPAVSPSPASSPRPGATP